MEIEFQRWKMSLSSHIHNKFLKGEVFRYLTYDHAIKFPNYISSLAKTYHSVAHLGWTSNLHRGETSVFNQERVCGASKEAPIPLQFSSNLNKPSSVLPAKVAWTCTPTSYLLSKE